MSAEVINHNLDLKRLQDEGYELEVKQGYAIIYNIPYLDSSLHVQKGILVSPLNISGETVTYRNEGNGHIIYFSGSYPYKNNGEKLEAIVNSPQKNNMADIDVNFMFSNKPQGGYKDYYHKFTNYIAILSNEARAIEPDVSAATFKRVVSVDNDVLVYSDTNSSRAAISGLTNKFRNQKVGIIGLGGTGSYILDQVAKTPVKEIHLFDGDVFCQHNAFRAPGAAYYDVFEKSLNKTAYFSLTYKNMHKNITAHPYNLTLDNVDELAEMSFVFIAIDSGEHKKNIVEYLIQKKIAFIDTGIDIQEANNMLLGSARITEYCDGDEKVINDNISFAETEGDIYKSNIQTADMNAFCALMAIIKWKKTMGLYIDNSPRKNSVYDTNDGEFK